MKKLLLLAMAVVGSGTAQAQARSSSEDLAAWYGIMVTPVGAFAPIEPWLGARPEGTRQIAVRGSRWKTAGTDLSQNNIGLTYLAPSATAVAYSVTVGWGQPGGTTTESGTIMIGADAGAPLLQAGPSGDVGNLLSIGWKASGGFGHSSTTGGIEYWSVVGQLPFKWTYRMANQSALSAFASAGYGVAGVGDFADAEQGMRAIFSFGGAWTSASGVGLHVGTQKVPLDTGTGDAPPWVTGLALSFPFGGK